MRLLFDTNILLDVLLRRDPWVTDAAALWQAHEDGAVVGYVAACTLTDIFYVARRLTDRVTAIRAVRLCLNAFEICAVDHAVLESALEMPGNDFEDNVQIACTQTLELDAIVTRDRDGFLGTDVPILLPAEALARLG